MTQCQASETGSHLNVTKSFLLLTSSLPNSAIALRVFNDPAAAQSYQESCTPPLCSGRQLPLRAEQIFIINTYLIIDSPLGLSYKCVKGEYMTDTTKYRNTSLKNEVYTAGHLLAREMTPGLALSMSQTIELLIMEKIKKLGLESKLSSYTKPSRRQTKRKKKKNGKA